MPKLVSAGGTTTLSTNQVRPTAAESAFSAFFPPPPHSLFRDLLDELQDLHETLTRVIRVAQSAMHESGTAR
jgi:hypothetical protein